MPLHLRHHTASLTGTLQLVQVNSYMPSVGQTQQIVQAGAVTGRFGTITNSIPTVLTPKPLYISGNVNLTWLTSASTFLPFAQTPNQQGLARIIDSAINDPRLAGLVAYLIATPTYQLPAALNQITPAALASMHDVGVAGLNARGYSFLNRANELRAGSHGFSASGLSLYDPSGPGQSVQAIPVTADAAQIYAMSANDPLNPTRDNPWGVYVEGQGEFTDIHGDANASGYHLASGGLTLGIDRRLGQELVVGFTIGYNDMIGSLANGGQMSVDNGQASLYAAWFKDGFHLEGMVGGGYDWQKGNWSFGPQLSLQYQRLDVSAFSETDNGAGTALHIDAQSYESLQTQLGGRLGFHKEVGHGIIITPEFTAAWHHEYLNSGVDLTSQFANGAGTAFTTAGPTLGKDSLVTGFGVSVQWTPTVGTFLNCTTEFGSGYEQQNVNAGVGFRF